MTPEERKALARKITNAVFTTVRLREGYDMGQVDTFLDDLVAALEDDRPVDDLIREARFVPVRLREGYDMAEVDELLARVLSATGGSASRSVDRTPWAYRTRPEPAPADPAPAAYPTPTGAEGVIEEHRGLLARLLGRR